MNIWNQVVLHLQSPRVVWLMTVIALMTLSLVGGAPEIGSCGTGAC